MINAVITQQDQPQSQTDEWSEWNDVPEYKQEQISDQPQSSASSPALTRDEWADWNDVPEYKLPKAPPEMVEQLRQQKQIAPGAWKPSGYGFNIRPVTTTDTGKPAMQREGDLAIWYGKEQGNEGEAGWFLPTGERAGSHPGKRYVPGMWEQLKSLPAMARGLKEGFTQGGGIKGIIYPKGYDPKQGSELENMAVAAYSTGMGVGVGSMVGATGIGQLIVSIPGLTHKAYGVLTRMAAEGLNGLGFNKAGDIVNAHGDAIVKYGNEYLVEVAKGAEAAEQEYKEAGETLGASPIGELAGEIYTGAKAAGKVIPKAEAAASGVMGVAARGAGKIAETTRKIGAVGPTWGKVGKFAGGVADEASRLVQKAAGSEKVMKTIKATSGGATFTVPTVKGPEYDYGEALFGEMKLNAAIGGTLPIASMVGGRVFNTAVRAANLADKASPFHTLKTILKESGNPDALLASAVKAHADAIYSKIDDLFTNFFDKHGNLPTDMSGLVDKIEEIKQYAARNMQGSVVEGQLNMILRDVQHELASPNIKNTYDLGKRLQEPIYNLRYAVQHGESGTAFLPYELRLELKKEIDNSILKAMANSSEYAPLKSALENELYPWMDMAAKDPDSAILISAKAELDHIREQYKEFKLPFVSTKKPEYKIMQKLKEGEDITKTVNTISTLDTNEAKKIYDLMTEGQREIVKAAMLDRIYQDATKVGGLHRVETAIPTLNRQRQAMNVFFQGDPKGQIDDLMFVLKKADDYAFRAAFAGSAALGAIATVALWPVAGKGDPKHGIFGKHLIPLATPFAYLFGATATKRMVPNVAIFNAMTSDTGTRVIRAVRGKDKTQIFNTTKEMLTELREKAVDAISRSGSKWRQERAKWNQKTRAEFEKFEVPPIEEDEIKAAMSRAEPSPVMMPGQPPTKEPITSPTPQPVLYTDPTGIVVTEPPPGWTLESRLAPLSQAERLQMRGLEAKVKRYQASREEIQTLDALRARIGEPPYAIPKQGAAPEILPVGEGGQNLQGRGAGVGSGNRKKASTRTEKTKKEVKPRQEALRKRRKP